jgi:hypothetical protein
MEVRDEGKGPAAANRQSQAPQSNQRAIDTEFQNGYAIAKGPRNVSFAD